MASMERLKERAITLPTLAFFLLTPPILLVFNSSNQILGIPVLYIYTFIIWVVLTIAGLLLTRTLQKAERREQIRQQKSKAREKEKFERQLS